MHLQEKTTYYEGHPLGKVWCFIPIIPATCEAEIGLWFEDSPGKMLVRFFLKSKSGMVVHAYNLNYLGGEGKRICLRPS
jgi:hypothetical protein